MSANYITLCNKVLRRLNETTFTSATFGTLTGFHGQVMDAVNDAVRDIYRNRRIRDANFEMYRMTNVNNAKWQEMVDAQYQR